jgi:uroporphyrin-III C-methyltransferase
MKTRIPKITLVGAGPGDPELLSMAGLEALENADAVLYDALVNPLILDYASKKCELIYVGKRLGAHAYKQEEINQMLVDCALKYGHVVRLKGGDPYVFGRGNEELQYAQARNIETKVIPGMSSSLALADLVGIPLIYDDVSTDFWVITGSTKNGNLSDDLLTAVKLDVTVVILMGMHHISAITALYREEKKQLLPVAIVQNGSLPDQRVVTGTISDIEQKITDQGIGAPAIIIIGQVVGLRSV